MENIFQVLSDSGDVVFKFSHNYYRYEFIIEENITKVFFNCNNKLIKLFKNSCIIDD